MTELTDYLSYNISGAVSDKTDYLSYNISGAVSYRTVPISLPRNIKPKKHVNQ